MDIDENIKAVMKLIAQREEIDRQLASLFGGQAPERKERVCSRCQQPGHTSRNCQEAPQLQVVS